MSFDEFYKAMKATEKQNSLINPDLIEVQNILLREYQTTNLQTAIKAKLYDMMGI